MSNKNKFRLRYVWVPVAIALIGFMGALIPVLVKNASETSISQQSDFTYSVVVQVKDAGERIPNAEIIIEVQGQAPLDEVTDSNGFARIFISEDRAGEPARLTVQATGYQRHIQSINLKLDALPKVVQLKPVR